MGSVVKCDVILSTDENVGGQIISNVNTEANDGNTQYYCFSKGIQWLKESFFVLSFLKSEYIHFENFLLKQYRSCFQTQFLLLRLHVKTEELVKQWQKPIRNGITDVAVSIILLEKIAKKVFLVTDLFKFKSIHNYGQIKNICNLKCTDLFKDCTSPDCIILFATCPGGDCFCGNTEDSCGDKTICDIAGEECFRKYIKCKSN